MSAVLRGSDALFVASDNALHLLRLSNSLSPSIGPVLTLPSAVLRMAVVEEGVVAILADKRAVLVAETADGFAILSETSCSKRPVSLGIYRLSPDKTALLLADKAGEVWATDLPSMQRRVFLGGHCASVITDLAVSPCGLIIATCDRDEKVRLSSLPSFDTVRYCLGHVDVVTSVSFVPGRSHTSQPLLCSVGWDFTLFLWDCSSGRLLDRLAFDASSSRHKQQGGDGDEALLGERVYDENEAGSFPFKVVAFSGAQGEEAFAAVLFRGEKTAQVVKIIDDSEGWKFSCAGPILLDSIPSEVIPLSPGIIGFLTGKPTYLSCYDLGFRDGQVVIAEHTGRFQATVNEFRTYCSAHGTTLP